MSDEQINEFCSLIYYPINKLIQINQQGKATMIWYRRTLKRLICFAKFLSSKYTRSKVRKALPPEFAYIIDELMHMQEDEDENQHAYHDGIIDTLIEIGSSDEFIISLSNLIKRLAVDKLHILGDIYDRGQRPDVIMEMLLKYHNVDFTWGNHDILWMGADAGNHACIASTIRNSLAYNNLSVLEYGYGINLRHLSNIAHNEYPTLTMDDASLKVITILMFKLEGQLIRRHPEYGLDNRLLLEKIVSTDATINLDGHAYPLLFTGFPMINKEDPYRLAEEERILVEELADAFMNSERLQRHVQLLYSKGSMYRCVNGNLLYHGCVPLREDGGFQTIEFNGVSYVGKAYLDFCDSMARKAYSVKEQEALDFMWFLWCADASPLCGRKIKTFERHFINAPQTWHEPRNPYYKWILNEDTCRKILRDFGLSEETGHIINGHTPVLLSKGETPIRTGGYLFVIDGGFCKAYQSATGIAGYTLIANSHGFRLVTHLPMDLDPQIISGNQDIISRQAESFLFSKTTVSKGYG